MALILIFVILYFCSYKYKSKYWPITALLILIILSLIINIDLKEISRLYSSDSPPCTIKILIKSFNFNGFMQTFVTAAFLPVFLVRLLRIEEEKNKENKIKDNEESNKKVDEKNNNEKNNKRKNNKRKNKR